MTLGGFAAGCWRTGIQWRGNLCLRSEVGGERVKGIGPGAASPKILPVLHLGPSIGVETGSRWVVGLDLIGQASPWRDVYVVDNVVENPRQEKAAPVATVWLVARVALTSRRRQN
jgi:hypothetical protein